MKPGARRSESDFDDDYVPPPSIGSASSNMPPDDGKSIGRLLVPDPEQRHGWREFYVYRDEAAKPRSVGFRR